METYVVALILGFLALIIRHAIKESLEGFTSNTSSGGSAAVITHQNTAGIKHTDDLIKSAKERIKTLISNVSKSIEGMKKNVEKNTANIAKNAQNNMKMVAAVQADKKKKKK